ncbi:MAG TPA: GAF domain-containing protein [Prolixibacteraceae bacterium]|nr:GAF domain-containing protein [Prolixibacteraceae bacterium]
MNIEEILKKTSEIIDSNQNRNEILHRVANLLKEEVAHYDWVGFYIFDKQSQTLILGPYVGKATEHTHIPIGKGVCGQVAQNKQTMIVQDVSIIDNYIACSLDVLSEIVVPIILDDEFVAEIDIDSHAQAPFTNADKELLEQIALKLKPLFV